MVCGGSVGSRLGSGGVFDGGVDLQSGDRRGSQFLGLGGGGMVDGILAAFHEDAAVGGNFDGAISVEFWGWL